MNNSPSYIQCQTNIYVVLSEPKGVIFHLAHYTMRPFSCEATQLCAVLATATYLMTTLICNVHSDNCLLM